MDSNRILAIFLIFILNVASSERQNDVKDIQIKYFNRPTVVTVSLFNFSKLLEMKDFKKRTHNILFIHGYEGYTNSKHVKKLIDIYKMYKKNTNIILVDWANMSSGGYVTNAALNAEKVGKYVGHYLIEALNAGLDVKNLHIIAHSLGCHVAAAIGHKTKLFGITLNRITGLDCSFPLYYPSIVGRRLSKDSAEFVDGIHTDSMMLGAPLSFGHVDFWPNGGKRIQPGCKTVNVFQHIGFDSEQRVYCSHLRAVDYFIESVQNRNSFLAVKCKNYANFQSGKCSKNSQTVMGIEVSRESSDDYYLMTNDKYPYGKGAHGIKFNPPK